MKRYVDLTALYVPPGGPLFCSLVPPYKPLSANSLGRITKNLLKKLGVPMEVFGPHSTRGAGVKFYKDLGLSSEQVCELGQWKNAGAFTTHYLRLGAAETAERILNPFLVHSVSSSRGVEPEGTYSPRTENDLGRYDPEGEAPREDETC